MAETLVLLEAPPGQEARSYRPSPNSPETLAEHPLEVEFDAMEPWQTVDLLPAPGLLAEETETIGAVELIEEDEEIEETREITWPGVAFRCVLYIVVGILALIILVPLLVPGLGC